MAERKAVNKWYPSDFDPKKHGSANGYQKSHHLRERARKLDQGILIVRFELPFNIWCLGCNNHIGMGVRYNAEKKKIGNYYSTKIYEFRMKCHLCTNYFTIKTDPQNLDYVVESGARRQNKRWKDTDNEQIVTDDKDKKDKLESNSMFKLEHLAEDKNKLLRLVPTLERLEDFQEERYKDDYKSNQELRKIFRTERNRLKLKAIEDKKLLDKLGNSEIIIEDEDPNDVRLSKLMKLNNHNTADELKVKKRNEILFDSIGLQKSTIHTYLNQNNLKTPELKSIAKSILNKTADQINRNNLKLKLGNLKKVKMNNNSEDNESSNCSNNIKDNQTFHNNTKDDQSPNFSNDNSNVNKSFNKIISNNKNLIVNYSDDESDSN